MRKFEYRTPRFPVDLPVSFAMGDSTLLGKCQEIGMDGMKVVLQQRVPEGTCGTLTIRCKEVAVDLHVCVAHSGPECEGLKFLFESVEDRNAVARLVGLSTGSNPHPGPVLVR
jgi:hypothetical protein